MTAAASSVEPAGASLEPDGLASGLAAGLAGLGLPDNGSLPSLVAILGNLSLETSTHFPENDTDDEFHTYELPVWRQVLWSALFAGMVSTGSGTL